MQAWQATVQDEAGNVIFNPAVTVYEADGVTLASIYNEDGSVKANPFIGSLEGFVQFWARPGVYTIRGASDGSDTDVWEWTAEGAVDGYADALNLSQQDKILDISANIGGSVVRWVRDPSGPCLGGGWSPEGYEITPNHMGMTGGEADASLLFQIMLDWISTDPNRMIVDRFIGTRIFLAPLSTTGNVHWDAGVARYEQDHNARFFTAHGNADAVAVPIDADYVPGSKEVSVSLPIVPKRGDFIRIVSDAVNPNDRSRIGNPNKYRVQEFAEAGEGSTASSVVLEGPLRFVEGMDDAETTVIPAYTTSSNSRVALFDSSKKFLFSGGRIEQTNGRTGAPGGFLISAYYKPIVEGATFYNFFGSAVFTSGTIRAVIRGCTFGNIADNELAAGQQGYGVSDGGEYTLVTGCNFGKCRHAYSSLRSSISAGTPNIFASGNTVGGIIENCTAFGCSSKAFDTHHGSVDISFLDCTAISCLQSGFGGRGIGHVVRGCKTVLCGGGFNTIVEASPRGNAGGLDRYATSFTVDGCVFQGIGGALYCRNSRVLVRNSEFRSSNMGVFRVENSLVSISGRVSVINSTENGALPLTEPAGERWPILVRAGTLQFGGASNLTVLAGGLLHIDASAFSTLPVTLIAVESGTTATVHGDISVSAPDNTSLFSLTASRFTFGPKASLFTGASVGFSLGTLSGRVPIVYRDGVSLDPSGQEYASRTASNGSTYRDGMGLQTCLIQQSFDLVSGDWVAVGGLFRAPIPGWTYPTSFTAEPTTDISVRRSDVWSGGTSGGGTTTVAPTAYIWANTAIAGSFVVVRRAQGRWKSLAEIPLV